MAHTEGGQLAKVSESQKVRVVGLESATRLHEVGIASNRGSECHGEYVRALYTPPVTPWEWAAKKWVV